MLFQNFIKRFQSDREIHIFLIIWFIINLIQASFTGIFHDEAYYWLFSQNLDWGYFDHPPMIALLIKIGYSIIPNELGVRLIPIIMGTLTIYFTYKLIDVENKKAKWFIYIISSMVLFHSHIGGFLALPDMPLIFGTTLFFYLYKKFLKNENYKTTLLLAIVIAFMIYSKYHGILVLFFTILSNWKIILKPKFWIMVVLSILLLSPHIYWQIMNDLPSVKYHLHGRSDTYSYKHTINYIYSQIIVAGPLMGFLVLFYGFKYRPKDSFHKSLKFTLVGFYIFFFFSTFKGHTEAHWLATAFIPLVILAYKEIITKPKALRWCGILFYPSIVLLILLRIFLMYDFLPDTRVRKEMHHWNEWANDIENVAGDLPVIFMNSYQSASKYTFYTGNESLSLNNAYYRKNQFDLWDNEQKLQGKDVFIVFPKYRYPLDTLKTSNNKTYLAGKVSNFRSYNKVLITIDDKNPEGKVNSTLDIPVKFENTSYLEADFKANPELKSVISYILYQRNKIIVPEQHIKNYELKNIEAGGNYTDTLSINLPAEPGKYDLLIAIKTGWFPTGLNGEIAEIVVK